MNKFLKRGMLCVKQETTLSDRDTEETAKDPMMQPVWLII